MIQMCHLKALNQVLITFCETAILECTLKVVGHFASWSHCARGCMQDFFGRLPRAKRKSAIKDELLPFSNGEIFGAAERLSGMSV